MGNDQLKKTIGFWVGTSIVVGTVIGSGIFMRPGDVLELSGNSTMALLAWLIGGLITLASGLTIAEVSTRIPKTGGLYVYMEEVYGKVWGFLCGWVQTLVYGPAVMGALSLYFGLLVAGIFNIASGLYIGYRDSYDCIYSRHESAGDKIRRYHTNLIDRC